MSKSVLVIDTPENCLDCQVCYELDEGVEACCSIIDDKKDKSLMKEIDCEYGYCQGKPDWCPLRELPSKKNWGEIFNGNVKGWNDCLREITGSQKINS